MNKYMTDQEIQECFLQNEVEVAIFQLLRQDIKLERLLTPVCLDCKITKRELFGGGYLNTYLKLDEESTELLLSTLANNIKIKSRLSERLTATIILEEDGFDCNRRYGAINKVYLRITDKLIYEYTYKDLNAADIRFDRNKYFEYFVIPMKKDIESASCYCRLDDVYETYEPLKDEKFQVVLGCSAQQLKKIRS